MSILINLLPDIRQAKLRERRRRQLVSSVAVVTWIVCAGVVVVLAVYAAGQKVIISNDSHSITSREAQLQAVSGLLDAYTAEQHLASLPSLYSQRVYLSKFFEAYDAADPTGVALSSLTVDAGNNLTVQGTAPDYATVAKLARALADSNVTVGPAAATGNPPYFSAVTITEASEVAGQGVSFGLTAVLSSGVVSGGQ